MNQPCRVNATVVTTKSEVREEWKIALLNSIDSRELSAPNIDVASHEGILQPSRVFPCSYIKGIQLRCSLLLRGACRIPEMINHVLQVCEVTHDGDTHVIIASYNALINFCANKASNHVSNQSSHPALNS